MQLHKKSCRSRSISLAVITALSLISGAVHAAPAISYSRAAHDALLRGAGAEHPADAANTLRQWLDRHDAQGPQGADRARVQADYLTLLARAGEHRNALDAAQAAGYEGLPAYTLDALFFSARQLPSLDDETRILQQLENRDPLSALTRLRRAQYAYDSGASGMARVQATTVLNDSHADATLRSAASELLGAIDEAQDEDPQASNAYARAIDLNPQSRSARRADIMLLAERNAAPAALEAANQAKFNPPLFSDTEMLGLRQQAIGQEIAWAVEQRDLDSSLRRMQPLDAVIRKSQALIQDIGTTQDPERLAIRNRARIDQLVALSGRERYRDCADLYEALQRDGVDVPYYGLAPAADAYAHLRRSDLALPLYERAVQEGGDNLPGLSDTHVGLFYAYIDTGNFKRADQFLTQLETRIPPTLRQAPAPDTLNPEYAELRDLRGRYYLYTDQPARAEAIYAELNREAPFNASFADGQARTSAAREQPRKALARAQTAVADHPESIPLRGAVAQNQMATGQAREGRLTVEALEADYPELDREQEALRDRDAQRAPTLTVAAAYGKGKGSSVLSDEDYLIDSRLQSGLIDDQWRVFLHQDWAYGNADGDKLNRRRTGLGLSWERLGWQLSAEAYRDAHGPRRAGFALNGSYQLDDHWVFGLGYDSNSLDVPWRAYDADITGRRSSASVGYIVNESRRFDFDYQRLSLSDGNRNDQASASWTERWYSGPSQQFQTTLSAGASHNRDTDVPYYSPSSDRSVEVEARYQLLTWKLDDRTFVQRIYASAGNYRQSGYGSQAMYGLRYEHEWNFRPGWSIAYGIGRVWHPYDGERERRDLAYLNLTIPFL